jgi:hypothetical protein
MLSSTPLLAGQTILGNIAAIGTADTYSFSLTQGNAFELTMGDTDLSETLTSGPQPDITIYGPDHQMVDHRGTSSNIGQTRLLETASQTGQYTVVARSSDVNGQFTGPYSIELAVAPATQGADGDNDGGPIVSGQTKFAAIQRVGNMDVYTFNASANNAFEVTMGDTNLDETATSGPQPDIRIFGPDGVLVDHRSLLGNIGEARLLETATLTGTYTVIAESTDGNGFFTGPYSIELVVAPATQAADGDKDGGPIVSGQTKFAAIQRVGNMDVYTFSAKQNNAFEVTMGDTSLDETATSGPQPEIRVFGPDGALVNHAGLLGNIGEARLLLTAPLTGTYTIIAESTDGNGYFTGPYSLELAIMPPPASHVADSDNDSGTLAVGQTRSGSIQRLGDIDLYSFTASVGDSFQVVLADANGTTAFQPDLHVYDPAGNLVNVDTALGNATKVFVNGSANIEGLYSVLVQDTDGNGFFTGDYDLTLTGTIHSPSIKVTAPAAQSATAGTGKSFSLGSFTAAYTTAPYSIDVNWGDGSADTIAPQTAAGTIGAQSHLFSKTGIDLVSITVTDAATTKSNVAKFNISISAPVVGATKLLISSQPTTAIAGAALSPVIQVKAVNAAGNLVTSDKSTVTLAIASGPTGGTITGTVTAKVVNGVAVFNGLSLKKAGAYTFKVTDGSLTAAVSKTITISPAAATKLVFAQQPTTGKHGVVLSPGIIVNVEDAFGNLVTADSSTVKLAVASGPSGGTVSGTVSVKAIKGTATFAKLTLPKAGTYTFKATDGKLATITSKNILIK